MKLPNIINEKSAWQSTFSLLSWLYEREVNMNKTRNISEYYDRLGIICGLIGVLIIGLIGAILSLF